ncbi:ClpP family protease [uncultured Allobaculum sp.]|uniref:ClpP family protease n=1 Tax=uncultured Allobaculum sp. TaxID=1187017 RepID=UPI0025842FA9|nr:ATP-dependent Clp protease proteolytic subunit [uncultured Allobaculum sp.]
MYLSEKSCQGTTLIPMETRHLSRRRILLFGEVDEEKANSIVLQLLTLNEEDPSQPIDLYINSPGGEVGAGLLIYDAMQSSPAPIHTVCMQKGYSMAAVLFAAGAKRLMFEDSQLMIHEPLLNSSFAGNHESLKEVMKKLADYSGRIHEILAAHTKKSVQEIEEASAKDRYFTLQEAIDFGLCDGKAQLGELIQEG